MSQETNKKNPEKSKQPNFKLRRMAALGLIGATGLVGGAGIVHAAAGKSLPLTPSEVAKEYDGYVDNSIDSVNIDKGARLRSSPSVSDESGGAPSNLLDQTDMTMKVEGNKKVIVHYDVNGEWFGLPAENLKESLKRVDPDLNLRGDSNGYVWVNEQKALAETSQVVDNPNQ